MATILTCGLGWLLRVLSTGPTAWPPSPTRRHGTREQVRPESWSSAWRRGEIAFGPAYKIMPTGQTGSKVVSVAKLLDGLWAMTAIACVLVPGQSARRLWHARLVTGRGLAGFMAAQIVADLKQAAATRTPRIGGLSPPAAPAVGAGLIACSGAIRTDDGMRATGVQKCDGCTKPSRRSSSASASAPPDAQDLQNCLCEFDKCERALAWAKASRSRRFVPRRWRPLPPTKQTEAESANA